MGKRTFASRTFASRTFAGATWAGVATGVAIPNIPRITLEGITRTKLTDESLALTDLSGEALTRPGLFSEGGDP